MGFTRSTTNVSVHQGLSDYPNQDDGLTAAQLKATFDFPAETLQNDLNNLEEELENVYAASKTGAAPLTEDDESDPNVQAKLEKIYEDLQSVVAGAIPDNSITEAKLASDYSSSVAKKSGSLQTNLNAEMLNGIKLPTLYASAKYHTPTYTLVSSKTTKSNYIPTMNSLAQDGFSITYRAPSSSYTDESVYKLFSSTYSSRSTEFLIQSSDYGTSSYITISLNDFAKLTTAKIYGKRTVSNDSYGKVNIRGSVDGTNWVDLGYVKMPQSYGEGTYTASGTTEDLNKYYKYFRVTNFPSPGTTVLINKVNFDVDYTSTTDNNRLDVNLAFSSYEDGQKLSIKVPSSFDVDFTTKIKLGSLAYKDAPNDLVPSEYADLVYNGTSFIRR